MSSHEFSIPVGQLDQADGKPFHFPVRAAWLRGALEDVDGVAAAATDGGLDVRLTKTGQDVMVQGSVEADLRVPCARCLEPFTLRVAPELSALMVHGTPPAAGGEEAEASTEDADLIPFDGETVILDDLVRDELLLAIPMIPLCSEACPGIHPPPEDAADARPAVDPRLAPLLRFKPSK